MRSVLITVLFIASATACVLADDFGPRGDVREVRFTTQRLLTHSARDAKADPNSIRLSDVVVVKDSALLSWDVGPNHGLMGLIRQDNRWWDSLDVFGLSQDRVCWSWWSSFPLNPRDHDSWDSPPNALRLIAQGMATDLSQAAAIHNQDVRDGGQAIAAFQVANPNRLFGCITDYHHAVAQYVDPLGGIVLIPRQQTSGYDIRIRYGKNSASSGTLATIYARPPTAAEFLPYPTTFRFVSTAVLYFDLTVDGSAPVKFQPGTTIDIWFPFVLDDSLKYDLTIGFADAPIGPIYAKPFDNVLRYTLPGFTATPGRALMAEVDGNRP